MAYKRINCHWCGFTFGQEKRYIKHLEQAHAVTDHFQLYIELRHGGVHPTCQCSDSCTSELTWSGWKKGFTSRYVRGHNARHDSVYKDLARQREFARKRAEAHASGSINPCNVGMKKREARPPVLAEKGTTVPISRSKKAPKLSPQEIAERSSQASLGSQQATENHANEIFEFVRSLGVDAVFKDQVLIAPHEVTVAVPSHSFAIELTGLYTHSQVFAHNEQNQRKHTAACDAGVKMLSVFEDEWRDKRHLIEPMIKHRLGMFTRVLNARKLKVHPVTVQQARDFFSVNHIDGYARSKLTLALCDGDDIVAAMSLREPFHKSKRNRLEVGRACCKQGYNVRGWLGKITKAALQKARDHEREGLMTYVDQRIGEGASYLAAGWEDAGTTGAPRFWWTDFVNRFNRFKYKADKSRGMTQAQVAEEAGVVMIFGCRNKKFSIDA